MPEPDGNVPASAAPTATQARWNRVRSSLSDLAAQATALGALIVLIIVLTILSPYFLTYANISQVVVETAVTAMIAVGMTLVIITAGIDLSVGSIAGLAGVIGALVMVQLHLPWPLATVIGVAVGGAAGLVNGALIGWVKLAPFIATLGMMGVAQGLTFISTGAVAVYGLPSSFDVLGQGRLGPVPIPGICLAGVIIIFWIIYNRTKLGRYSYAIGSNSEAARLVGIPSARYLVLVYVLQGALAGFGGMVAASRVSSGQPNFGVGLELDAIAASVIGGASLFGGVGTVSGTVIGAFLIQLIRNGSVLLNINSYVQDVIIGAIVWLAVAWDQLRRKRIAHRRVA